MDQPSAEPRRITVDLGQRSYDIHIGEPITETRGAEAAALQRAPQQGGSSFVVRHEHQGRARSAMQTV